MTLPVQAPLFDDPAHPDWALIPVEQGRRLLTHEYCELNPDTSPWCGPYAALAAAIPLARTVVDLGCYMGLQAALFTNHAGSRLCRSTRSWSLLMWCRTRSGVLDAWRGGH